MDSGTDRLVERPPSSRFSYAQMSRFPDYVESYNPTISGTYARGFAVKWFLCSTL